MTLTELNITLFSENALQSLLPKPFYRGLAELTLTLTAVLVGISGQAHAQLLPSQAFSQLGFAKLNFVSNDNMKEYSLPTDRQEQQKEIRAFCDRVSERYLKLDWAVNPCAEVKWKSKYKSQGANPLIYAEFGSGTMTSLYLGGVHPDELTPIHLIFKFADYLDKHPEVYMNKNIRIVIAPLVNPDSFFLDAPPRVNKNGVDLNRNFLTLDWYAQAIYAWRNRRSADTRYFPGYFPNSEIETVFQADLIEEFVPGKIISVHAPLGFLDYDGPGDQKPHELTKIEKQAKELIRKISEKSSNYKIVDYSFYPGSLGNYAGNEREIPTITLELETTDPKRVNEYWEKFQPGLILSAQLPYLAQQTPKPGAKTGLNSPRRNSSTALAKSKTW
jgi:protein MpaA